MKGLVLAGGRGTRLRPITHTSAKQLVPVANTPILFYGLRQLAAAGVTDVGIVVGQTGAAVRAAVGDGSAFGIDVTWVEQPEPLGIAHAVLVAADFLAGDDVVVFLGDNLLEGGVSELVEDFERERPDAHVLLKRVDDPGRFGVAEVDAEGRLLGLEEKPEQPRSDLALVGVYLFGPAVHEAVRAIGPSSRGELEITDAIQHLLDDGRDVRSTVLAGWWLDTGKKDELLDANQAVLAGLRGRVDGEVDQDSVLVGEVVVEAGARVVRSRVEGPVVVGADSSVVDSHVGPGTSIGAGCTVQRSWLAASVVLDGCVLRDAPRLERSLLGRGVTVTRAPDDATATRLLVGDDAVLEL